jgi:hypothetical protein
MRKAYKVILPDCTIEYAKSMDEVDALVLKHGSAKILATVDLDKLVGAKDER